MGSTCCKKNDIWSWIQNLPPSTQWNKDSMSICIYSSNTSLATLNLNITKHPSTQSISLALLANFNIPISLWISKPFHVSNSSSNILSDENTTSILISSFIQDVLEYGSTKQTSPINIQDIIPPSNLQHIFNVSFLTLAFIVCIYEAPFDLRFDCLRSIKDELSTSQARESFKLLIRLLGSSNEEQWMRCLNLGVTNWKMALKAANCVLKGPCPLFSHGFSTLGLWKVQLYCPIITMEIENTNGLVDERLEFSLNYHQLEGVIQLNYKVIVRDEWIEVMVNIDNIRLDVIRLISEKLLHNRGAGTSEKHFPSRMTLKLTPCPSPQIKILSISVNKSSENPTKEIGLEKTIEGSFEPLHKVGLNISAGESTTTAFTPWKFEETVKGDSGGLNWFLYDSKDGSEVFSYKPSILTLFKPKAWLVGLGIDIRVRTEHLQDRVG
ncbi:unnamed protein product [Amaranthus hypochondriacus]